MRIAVLADIHGNLPALEAVLADVARRGVTEIVTLGDHLSGPLLPAETAAFLLAQPWVQIAGNQERQLLSFDPATASRSDAYAHARLNEAAFAWLRRLPPTARLGTELFSCHGSPRSDAEFLLETVAGGGVRAATAAEREERLAGETAQVILCGHSHLPGTAETIRGQLVVNPGSVGLPAYDDTGANGSRYVVESGSSDARYAIVEKQADAWRATLLAVPYDREPMARLAEQNQRPDWAHALRSGRALPHHG